MRSLFVLDPSFLGISLARRAIAVCDGTPLA
jgi:hypothetical protein